MSIRCDTCNLTFKSNKTLSAHLKSQKHMDREGNNFGTLFTCACGKWYIHRQSINRHYKICNVHKEKEANNLVLCTEERKAHEEEKQQLRDQISTLMEKVEENKTDSAVSTQQITNNENSQFHGSHNNNHSNNKVLNNQNVTININAFGNEKTDYLKDKDFVNCINSIYNSVPNLINKIHFDPKHPENHNVKISNKKLPYASVLTKDNNWKCMDKNDAIDSMIDKSYVMLEISYEGNKDDILPRIQSHFEDFQRKFCNQDKKTMRNVKKKVELSLINA